MWPLELEGVMHLLCTAAHTGSTTVLPAAGTMPDTSKGCSITVTRDDVHVSPEVAASNRMHMSATKLESLRRGSMTAAAVLMWACISSCATGWCRYQRCVLVLSRAASVLNIAPLIGSHKTLHMCVSTQQLKYGFPTENYKPVTLVDRRASATWPFERCFLV